MTTYNSIIVLLSFSTLSFHFVLSATDKQISVFEFGYSDPMEIAPLESLTSPTGYSLCFRVQFVSWYKVEVLRTSLFSFSLKDYQSGLGSCRNMDLERNFNWKGLIPISYLFWNSVCATYHDTDRLFILALNGKIVLNMTEGKRLDNYIIQNPLESDFEIGNDKSFSGKLTDLNLWSRPLSTDELDLFSTGCNPQFVENSKPDKIIWSTLKITNQNKNPRRIQKSELCQDSAVLSNEDKVILRSAKPFYDYPNAFKYCLALNGQMPYPQNKTHLEKLLSNNKNAKDHCIDKVWIAITRSSKNASLLVYDTKNIPETIVPFQPLTKTQLDSFSKSNDLCMIAQLSSRQFDTSVCSVTLCFMCQFPYYRTILRLYGNSEFVGTIDNIYAMMSRDFESNSLTLKGLSGKSSINQEQGRFVIFNSNCLKAVYKTNDLSPMGIRIWNLKLNCDDDTMDNLTNTEILLKLSNVSLCLHYFFSKQCKLLTKSRQILLKEV